MYKSVNDNYKDKKKKLRDRQKEEINTLRYSKLIAETVKKIVEKDSKILSMADWDQITAKCYKNVNKIKTVRVKRMMSTDIAKNKINTELISIYSDAGLGKDDIARLLKEADEFATQKKDGNLKLKLAEKLEKAHNLVSSQPPVPRSQYNNQLNFNQYRDQVDSDNKADKGGEAQKDAKNEENDIT